MKLAAIDVMIIAAYMAVIVYIAWRSRRFCGPQSGELLPRRPQHAGLDDGHLLRRIHDERRLCGRRWRSRCSSASPAAVDDLLFLQESFFADRSWFSASPLVSPSTLETRLEMGSLSLAQLANYRDRLRRIEQIARRYQSAPSPPERELGRLAGWVVKNWEGTGYRLISDHLR